MRFAANWSERRPISALGTDPTAAEVAALVAAARRRLSHPVDDELIREAIDDALAGRRPRW